MMCYFIKSLRIPVVFSSRAKKNELGKELKDSLLTVESMDMAVPKGCLAVYVGEDMRRFVIPTGYLRLPVFHELMERAAEEFGFNQAGGLRIPCEEEDFEELLKVLEGSRPAKTTKNKTIKKLVKWA